MLDAAEHSGGASIRWQRSKSETNALKSAKHAVCSSRDSSGSATNSASTFSFGPVLLASASSKRMAFLSINSSLSLSKTKSRLLATPEALSHSSWMGTTQVGDFSTEMT